MYSLVGVDGNAYALMGYTRQAMKENGFTKDEIDLMLEDAKSGDYYHLIAVCDTWIDQVNKRAGMEEEDD